MARSNRRVCRWALRPLCTMANRDSDCGCFHQVPETEAQEPTTVKWRTQKTQVGGIPSQHIMVSRRSGHTQFVPMEALLSSWAPHTSIGRMLVILQVASGRREEVAGKMRPPIQWSLMLSRDAVDAGRRVPDFEPTVRVVSDTYVVSERPTAS